MVEEIEAWRGWTTSHASRDDGEALPVDMTLVHGISSSKSWTGDGKKTGTCELPGRRRSTYSLYRKPVARTPRCIQAPVVGAAGTECHHHIVLLH
jgi:hypothetical protein